MAAHSGFVLAVEDAARRQLASARDALDRASEAFQALETLDPPGRDWLDRGRSVRALRDTVDYARERLASEEQP